MAITERQRPALNKTFYGWWMVLAASGLQFVNAGLIQQSFGAYVAVLRDDFDWSKTALAGAFSLQQVEGGLIGPLQGLIVDRFGTRGMIRIGVVILGAGLMLLSQIDSLPTFYAAFLVVALGSSLCGFFPLTVALVNWFERKRARALSTMSLGFAMGGLVVPIVAYSLETFGWRTTAFASGVLAIAVGLPLSQIIRRRPEDHGEVVDGIGDAARAETPVAPLASESDFTAREALRTPAFWLISLGHGSALFVVGAVSVHAISHMKEDLGYSVGAASLVITLMTIFQITGMLIGGAIGDRFDKRLIAAGCMLMHTAGLLLIAYAVVLPMVIGFAVLHGIAWGLRGPLMQAIRADYFGRSSFGMIMGISSTVIMFGQIGGPLVAGIMADATGDYKTGFTVLAILTGLGAGFFVAAKRPPPPARLRDLSLAAARPSPTSERD
ncbi:MAG TPA: MFS transporter [Dehalococcoidia bacterium]|nr:MFS transporter [Dehalococcoidia bacterium]